MAAFHAKSQEYQEYDEGMMIEVLEIVRIVAGLN
jgi:hypothetical protein